jgi:predicted TIM-barrel fold metal-dependent hydrolase
LPADYRKIAEPLGVVAMIEMECSPWVEDNYWVLEVAARDPIVVGTVGSLHPTKPEFQEHLPRLQKNPLFRGIRFNNQYKLNLNEEIPKEEFISNMKALADAKLVLDGAGQASLLTDFVRITDKVPDLRVVVDHLPNTQTPEEPAARAAFEEARKELGKRPQVYVKVSEIFHPVDQSGRRARSGRIPHDLNFYRSTLDTIYEVFGPDRLLFGSDWTNSEPMGTFEETFKIVQDYFMSKGRDIAEKFFWKNSSAAYRWVKRHPNQPASSPA